MVNHVSLSQQQLMSTVMPMLQQTGNRYRKIGQVQARRAVVGETVVSITSDGRETTNVAVEGDYRIRNNTEAAENYLVAALVFSERYELVENIDEHWGRYQARGRVLAVVVDDQVLSEFDHTSTFQIMPVWNSPQIVHPGDFLVTPWPDQKEIYRIASKEFSETYQRLMD
jgi:hypothetical protein